jgi:putative transposase
VTEVAKKLGVSEVTIYAWRKRFGELEPVDARRLRQLETENGRLKKVLAERVIDIEILKEVAAKKMVRASVRRQQIAFVCQRGRSVMRGASPSRQRTVQLTSVKPRPLLARVCKPNAA